MGRPSRFDTDALVETAITVAARGGPAAVTMVAVARAAGAPSGSLYHRFPGRPALLAAVRLEALTDFQEGLRAVLAVADPLAAATGAARHVVAWSRTRPDRARVLLYSPVDFEVERWPAAERERMERGNARSGAALVGIAEALRAPEESAGTALERTRMAVVDLPLALVRRYLSGGGEIPAEAEDAAADAAYRLLAPRP
ncbi:TetR/AcrR family transcriptional regulator [Nocardiopsis lambiniae]|uniref:Helix-turn-helix domain-containing protein n=1 Tax=Nocardiopsis lambiniae TaxID=3075539 RepID=A0ABU2MCJ8_9ACTN|nr:helix-turn-helix domain-containing protein [Nocardiopsis sp. DSM 44743]MDT0329981.1 helix-turn-helix domain-containing protein [Nocardiopsis sp. DSM 44743]